MDALRKTVDRILRDPEVERRLADTHGGKAKLGETQPVTVVVEGKKVTIRPVEAKR